MSEDQNARKTLGALFHKHENELKAEGVTGSWTALLVRRITNDVAFINNTAGVRDFCTDRGGLEKMMNDAVEMFARKLNEANPPPGQLSASRFSHAFSCPIPCEHRVAVPDGASGE